MHDIDRETPPEINGQTALGTESRPDGVSPTADREHPERPVPASGPAPPGRRRRRVAPLVALVLIAGAIWYLQSGRALPFLDRSGGDAVRAGDTAGFVTFGSQGLKLGAAGDAAPKIGEPAPDFTLLDPEGNPVKLSDFRGKTVVMNFWATWCLPCRKEFPHLVRLYDQQAGRGLVVLGVDMQESPEIVRRFTEGFGARFPIVIDSKGDVGAQYRLLGLPTTYVIDAGGVIRGQHMGEITAAILARKLREAGFAGTP